MDQSRRIAAYGMCRDGGGRVLLVRSSAVAETPSFWSVPGGGVDHGEHPADAVVREFAEETGLTVAVAGLRAVVSDVMSGKHTDRVIYDVDVRGGTLRNEPDGATDLVAWVPPDEFAGLPLMPFTAELLGPVSKWMTGLRRAQASAGTTPVTAGYNTGILPRPARPQPTPGPRLAPAPTSTPALGVPVDPLPAAPAAAPAAAPDGRVTRGQRFAAYGLTTDPTGRVLLTRIADGYPGAGKWHLPGGGTDHGEQPAAALLRELAEESDQVGQVTGLLDVTHHRNPAARGPEGYPIDWHGVRALYRVRVDTPTEPMVTEAAGGSTAQARWFSVEEASRLRLTDVAVAALARLKADMDAHR